MSGPFDDPVDHPVVERFFGREPAVALAVLEDPLHRLAGVLRGSCSAAVRRLTPGSFTEAAGWMHDVGAAWDRRLDRLARRVTKAR